MDMIHHQVREDVVYVKFSSDVLISVSGDTMYRWSTAGGSCAEKFLDGHVYHGTTEGSVLTLQRGSLNGVTKSLHFSSLNDVAHAVPLYTFTVPLQMDQNRLCLKRDDITLPICCLPDHFKPTTPAIQHKDLVCIGGESGLIALINLNQLTIPDH